MAGETVNGEVRAKLLEDVQTALSAIGGRPINNEQVKGFLNLHREFQGKIVAADEVSDSDREEIARLYQADLNLLREDKKTDIAELRKLQLIETLGLTAGIVAAGAYLFGYLNFSVIELAELIVPPLSRDCGSGWFVDLPCSVLNFMLTVFGGLSWFVLAKTLLGSVDRRIQVLEAGGEEALAAQIEQENTPVSLGTLVGISNSQGGLFSSSQATIETSVGFYRVSGSVGGFARGVPVHQLHGYLLIGEGESPRKFWLLD